MFETKLALPDGRNLLFQFCARLRAQNKADLTIKLQTDCPTEAAARTELIFCDECATLTADKTRRKILTALKDKGVIVAEAVLLTAWEEYLLANNQPAAPVSPPPAEVFVGGMKQPRTTFKTVTAPTHLEAFKAALEINPPMDGVIEWEDSQAMAILDLDYHDLPDPERPSVSYLESLGHSLRPTPAAFWVSHGRGLHALYLQHGIFYADELAAAAALTALKLDSSCTVEVITRTRHPNSKRSAQ